MAKAVDELLIEIRAETQGLRRGLAQVEERLKKTNKSARSNILTFGNLTKVFAAVGAVKLGKSIIDTSRKFEDLGATMLAITGDTERAGAALATIEQFTAGTPFQLENVTQAFTRFYQAGITPTQETLTAFGNVAAANNKDITDLAQAVFNATTGEMEMLKQFGIVAKQNGDKVKMTFEGQTVEIDNTRDSIAEYVKAIGEDRFEGALEAGLNTVSGAFSNVADKSSLLQKEIGEAGLNQALTELGLSLGDAIEFAGETGLADILGNVLAGAVDILTTSLNFIVDNFYNFIDAAVELGIKIRNIFMVTLPNAFDKARIGFIEFRIGVIESFNILLRDVADKINDLIDLYNQIPFVDPKEPVKFEISTEEAKADIQEIRDQITERTATLKVFVKPVRTSGDTNTDEVIDESLIDPNSGNDVKKTSDAIMTMDEAMKDMKQTIVESTHAFSQDFVKGLMDGQDALAGFKDFAKNMVSQIIATFLQLAVVNQILNSIFGLTGKSALPTITIGGKSSGGKVQGRTPYMVGERGPELFVPDTTGTIRNNMDTMSMGGGGVTVVQNNNFALGVGATARAEVQKLLPQIAETSKMAVFEAAARGGSFRKGLLGGA